MDPHGLSLAVGRLARARSVLALTGAGISAESGMPTFREAQTGLWSRYDPLELATPEAFARNPELVWRWYAWRRRLALEAHPNAGHRALVDLDARIDQMTLVTQNVDGLHQRAGSCDVVEYHGNILTTICSRERTEIHLADPLTESLPHCDRCGAPARPAVVWFGELIPATALERANRAAASCEVFLSIGTSALVYPAAGLAETALRAGAFVIEVNPQPTPLTPLADVALHESASVALAALAAAAPLRL